MELWSDLDNNNTHDTRNDDDSQHATRSAQTGRRGRTRRLSEPLVYSTLRAWLLGDYVPSYSHALAMTHIYRRCYWLDALGTTNAAVISELSKAMLALTDSLAQASRPITLHGLVLEQGSSTRRDAHLQAARQRMTQTPVHGQHSKQETKAQGRSATRGELLLPETSGAIHTSWLAAADRLLQELEQTPTIFLLNPIGQVMFTSDDLMALYKRTAPTELCLLFSHKQVETLLLTAMRSSEYALALNAVLRSDKWKTLGMQTEESRVEAVSAFIDLFMKAMQRHFVFPVQRNAISMNLHPAVVELVPYTLLFATRRQDSLVCMNDALCRYRRGVYDQSYHGVLAEEWFVTQRQARHEEERVRLHAYIQQRGKAQRTRRWPDLRQQVLLDHFGQFLLHEYDNAIQTLIVEHAVTCEWRNRDANIEHVSVPGNDDVLVW